MPDVGEVLLHILIVLVFAKAAAEVSERIGVPAVVGEIVAGVLVGPSVLGWVGPDETLRVLAELGVILLLLDVGLHLDLAELTAVGRAALSVAVIGVVLPFAGGFAVGPLFDLSGSTTLFLAAALTATSVGITARVFGDLRALASSESRTVLGAAVADDVIGLVILTVVVKLVTGGGVSVGSVAGVVSLALGFLLVTGWAGTRWGPTVFDEVQRRARSNGTLVALALAYALALAELASAAGLAPIVGAFAAGLSLSRGRAADQIRRELSPVGHLFVPVFFLQIGIDARIGAFMRPAVLALAGALLLVAVVGKLAAGVGTGRLVADRLLIGIGMIPRGEVGLIFAGIGLREGVLGQDSYAALLLVVLVSTLMTPPLLKARLARLRKAQQPAVPSGERMPEAGWLVVSETTVDLAATPPATSRLPVSLRAARFCATRAPGPALLAWLSAVDEVGVRWDTTATTELWLLLTEGDVRSWRFLEATGVLDDALPELAEALHRRRRDPVELDPSGALRWSLVDAVRAAIRDDGQVGAAATALAHAERLLLAALVLDLAGDDRPVVAARRIAARLDLGAAAEQDVAALVGDTGLLRAAAVRPDGLREEHVLAVAVHLETVDRARMLYALTVARNALEPWERALVDELYRLVVATLARPGLTDRDTSNVVERRRAEAARLLAATPRLAARVNAAPWAYLLAQQPGDIARHARLLEPVPVRDAVRVRVSPTLVPGESLVEVAARDRPGLLAAVTAALLLHEVDVLSAVVATWPDGGALESFRVRAGQLPDAGILESGIVASLRSPVASQGVPEARLSWDDEASPWYSLCTVHAPDRPGLLHTLAVAIAAAGADVHGAEVSTTGAGAVDSFKLTDRTGRKLDDAVRGAVEEAMRLGVDAPRRRPFRKSHGVGTTRKHSSHRAEIPAP